MTDETLEGWHDVMSGPNGEDGSGLVDDGICRADQPHCERHAGEHDTSACASCTDCAQARTVT